MKIIEDLKIDIGPAVVLVRLGYDPDRAPYRIRKAVDRAVGRVTASAEPRAGYERVPVQVSDGRVVLDGRQDISSKKLRKVLGPCSDAVVFVSSLGPEVDRVIDALQADDRMSDAYITDFAASEAAEGLAEEVQARIGTTLGPGESMTCRYSPGYCDWNVTDQEALFGIMDASAVGVRLGKNCLMSPRKSVSGVIGVGPSAGVEPVANACNFCKNTKCEYRREEA